MVLDEIHHFISRDSLGCNYEGMVAKDPGSGYTPGRTLSWLKVKQRGYRQEARGFDEK